MTEMTNVIFAGVGGQGVLLIAEMLALAAAAAGHDVKQTEVHGVSQRGGAVESHVRYGPKVYSPLVTAGEAHAVVGLEKLEMLRFAHYVRPDGVIIVNDYEIEPLSVGAATANYPHHAIEFLRGKALNVLALPATATAKALGNVRAANMILLGALAAHLDIPLDVWERTLQTRIPPKHLALNQEAFRSGQLAAVSGQLAANGRAALAQSPIAES
jgi:indolepyruvate ferredoxin oxidoreductase beta subunit